MLAPSYNLPSNRLTYDSKAENQFIYNYFWKKPACLHGLILFCGSARIGF